MRELASEQYADIDNRHRFAFIGLHTTEEALKDVVRYYDALDKVRHNCFVYFSVGAAELHCMRSNAVVYVPPRKRA